MEQRARQHRETVEVYFHSQQPYTHVTEEDLGKYDSRLAFPNTYFDPQKARVLYNQYHEQYALVDEVGIDGIVTNEHHSTLLEHEALCEPGRGRYLQGHQESEDFYTGEHPAHQ